MSENLERTPFHQYLVQNNRLISNICRSCSINKSKSTVKRIKPNIWNKVSQKLWLNRIYLVDTIKTFHFKLIRCVWIIVEVTVFLVFHKIRVSFGRLIIVTTFKLNPRWNWNTTRSNRRNLSEVNVKSETVIVSESLTPTENLLYPNFIYLGQYATKKSYLWHLTKL